MRCQACNVALSEFEATRKHAVTGEFLDLCNHCFKGVKYDLPVIERADLITEESVEEDDFEDYSYDEE